MGEQLMRWSQRLPFVAAVAAVVVLSTTAAVVLVPGARAALGFADAVAYRVGDRFDIPLTSIEPLGRKLVIIGKTTCSACQAAAEFLRGAVETAAASGVVPVVVVPMAESEQRSNFAERLGVAASNTLSTDLAGLRVERVPLVMLIDEDATILRIWRPAAVAEADPTIVEAIVALRATTR